MHYGKTNVSILNLQRNYYRLYGYTVHEATYDLLVRAEIFTQCTEVRLFYVCAHSSISTYIAWTHSDMGVVSISGSTAFKHVMAALGHSTVTDTKAFLLTQFSHLIIQYP